MKLKCRVCKKYKPDERYYKASKPGFIDKICKECKHNLQQIRRKDLKSLFVSVGGGECANCGYKNCNNALQFHHLNPSEKEFIMDGDLKDINKAMDELIKCVLLCANCHIEIHCMRKCKTHKQRK